MVMSQKPDYFNFRGRQRPRKKSDSDQGKYLIKLKDSNSVDLKYIGL